jgi:hypothetical protein
MRSRWNKKLKKPYQQETQPTDFLSTHKIIILIIGFPIFLFSRDFSWDIGVISYQGRGDQEGEVYNYNENFLSLTAHSGPWYLDLNLEYSSPPEYGLNFAGIQHALLRYSNDSWMLEAGDISAVFGRGLSLNLFDDQTIDFDNRILGVRAQADVFSRHQVQALAGMNENHNYYSSESELRKPDGNAKFRLAGVETTINSKSGTWSFSPYYLHTRMISDHSVYKLNPAVGIVRRDTSDQTQNAVQLGWSQSLYRNSWDVYLEYSHTWRAYDQPLLEQSIYQSVDGIYLQNDGIDYERQGQALNIQINWFPSWATIMFDYRRYLNGPELNRDKRNPLLLGQKALLWQLGPTGIRQHDVSLLANVTHPVDYGDELGWTLELSRSLRDQWRMILYASQISQARDSRDVNQDPGFFASGNIAQHPWAEYFIELEYLGQKLSQRMLAAYTKSVLSGVNTAEVSQHYTFVPAYLSWIVSADIVSSLVLELQQTRVSGRSYSNAILDGHSFNSSHLVGSVDYGGNYSLSFIWDASDDPLLNAGTHRVKHWVSGEISVKPLDGLWVRASYGKEKGGVRCTGGVCRILNPYEGFRLSLEWRR